MRDWNKLKVPESKPFEDSEVERLMAHKSWHILTAISLAIGGQHIGFGLGGRHDALRMLAREEYFGGVLPGEREYEEHGSIYFYVRPDDWVAWLRRIEFPLSDILLNYCESDPLGVSQDRDLKSVQAKGVKARYFADYGISKEELHESLKKAFKDQKRRNPRLSDRAAAVRVAQNYLLPTGARKASVSESTVRAAAGLKKI